MRSDDSEEDEEEADSEDDEEEEEENEDGESSQQNDFFGKIKAVGKFDHLMDNKKKIPFHEQPTLFHNSEYVVFNAAQVRVRYLIEIEDCEWKSGKEIYTLC